MMYRITLLVACATLAPSALAVARDVEVKTFHENASGFQLIEPGLRPQQGATPTLSQAGSLESDFAQLAAKTQPATTSSNDRIDLIVPAWMRAGKGPFEHIGLPAPTMSLTGCGPVHYAPHPMLNASQQRRRQRFFGQMAAAACGAGVPVDLFDALIIQESRYNPLALSTKGASGLTQLMPETARSLGIFDRWSVSQNLLGGARYLRKQLDTFGNWAHSLGAYNAGPGNVTKYGGVPPFRETRGYVQTILSNVDMYQRSRGRLGGAITMPRRNVTLSSFRP